MPREVTFPNYSDSRAQARIADLLRLMDRSLMLTEFVNGPEAARLLAQFVEAYAASVQDPAWRDDDNLRRCAESGHRLGLVLAAAFDLICNAEYVHGRVVNSSWIYCHRQDEDAFAYYSFLKQCPRCCLDKGLGPRIRNAQHKPASHHIGEITTTVTALVLQLLVEANDVPFAIATITKQSHDTDAIGFSSDLLVLFEIKSSPMVTYPLRMRLPGPLVTEDPAGGRTEYRQHTLMDVQHAGKEVELYVPHRNWAIPLGAIQGAAWPYPHLSGAVSTPAGFLRYLTAWLELYFAYSVPKTRRTAEQQTRTYLVNGWGDEIDSNKTKPGLGRTDDIKKGTYQLLKFGAYYRDDSAATKVRGCLAANLDPLFLRPAYLDELVDVRWGKNGDFRPVEGGNFIAEGKLRFLYDAILTFNSPALNDPELEAIFNISRADLALREGRLEALFEGWRRGALGVEAEVPAPPAELRSPDADIEAETASDETDEDE